MEKVLEGSVSQIREEVGLGSGEGPGGFSCRSHIVVVRHKIQTCGR